MKVLFIQPRYPDTFWSLRHALRFISKKAVYPPLGLMTVSAMTPGNWTKKLVDLNTSFLKDEQIIWADIVFISAMSVQSESVFEVIKRCRSFHKKMVGGGPLFTEEPEKFDDVDYLVLNEADRRIALRRRRFAVGPRHRRAGGVGYKGIGDAVQP